MPSATKEMLFLKAFIDLIEDLGGNSNLEAERSLNVAAHESKWDLKLVTLLSGWQKRVLLLNFIIIAPT